MKTVRCSHAAFAFGCAAIATLGGDGLLISPAARAQDMPADALAARLRIQGHRCDKALTAERDPERSRPDSAVWIVTCTDAAYRMQLVPNGAARIEAIDTSK